MTRAKGIATVLNLQTYLQAMDSLRARMAVVIEKMQELEIDQIPKFGDDAMKASLTNIHTGLCTCEERIGARSGLPWEFTAPEKKKPTPETKAGASVAKLIVKTGAQSRGRDRPVSADSGGQTEGKTER
jgi:hypothetical protein